MGLTFSFNGVDSSTYGIIGSPTVPLLPTKRKNAIEIPGMDGAYDFKNNSYEPRTISIDCYMHAESRAALYAALSSASAWLSGEGDLILGRDTTKCWKNAKQYNQLDIKIFGYCAQFIVAFECNPPFPEDINATTGTIGTPQDYGSPLESESRSPVAFRLCL